MQEFDFTKTLLVIDKDKREKQEKRTINSFKSMQFLPKEIVIFLEKLYNLPKPIIKKNIAIDFDKKAHAQGKSIFSRKELYPYKNLDKAEEYLNNILSLPFPKDLSQNEFFLTIQVIQKDIENEKKLIKQILNAFLDEDEAFYQKQAEKSSTYSFLCYFLANFAFLPFFEYTQEKLQAYLIKNSIADYFEQNWPHGHCPYCGSLPLISYIATKEGKRLNACSTCLGLYRVPRIQCPYCLEQKQENFSYFNADTDKDFQVAVCKKCNNYIKIKDSREDIDFLPSPLLDDFKSLTLDIIAENNNFTKAVLSLWLC